MPYSRRASVITRMTAILALVVLCFLAFPPAAHAGFFDGVKGIFQLPGEVDKLKEDYQQVKDNYDTTIEQLEETKRQAENALQQAEAYKQMQEKLTSDNAALMEQNRQLTSMVQELRHSEEARAKQSARIKHIIWVAVLLVAGYFAISRIARYVMRDRNRKR